MGASETSPYLHAYVSTDRVAEDGFDRIVCEIEAGLVEEVAFVLPYEWVWPLPLYELALMTAHRARRANRSPRITFVTPEARPLKAFGRAAGDELLGLLGDAGVRLHTGVVARVPATGVVTFVGGEVRAERIVTLPSITGPAVTGVPAGSRWFVPINERCVVPSTDGRVFAAGDATDFPVSGGHRRPAGGRGGGWYCPHRQRRRSPPPLHPVIRGVPLTGARPLYVAAKVVDGRAGSRKPMSTRRGRPTRRSSPKSSATTFDGTISPDASPTTGGAASTGRATTSLETLVAITAMSSKQRSAWGTDGLQVG